MEWLLNNGHTPVVYFYNPNIYPEAEYEKRKAEIVRHCQTLGVECIDGDYDHDRWLAQCSPLADAPERGARCTLCFRIRLLASAQKAKELGISTFATTLASSRWKNIKQVNAAGLWAAEQVNQSQEPRAKSQEHSDCTDTPRRVNCQEFSTPPALRATRLRSSMKAHSAFNREIAEKQFLFTPYQGEELESQEPPDNAPKRVAFWANNWRKGGLQQRRQELLKQYGFYNQLYCGCEFSMKNAFG